MPQMMPLNWLMLMMFFISIFLIFNNMNFYILTYKNLNNKLWKPFIKMNWKW